MSEIVYPDAGVLIAAGRGALRQTEAALRELRAADREFAASVYLRLEVEPKARFHRHKVEADFYRIFFDGVSRWALASERLAAQAHELASRYDLNAMDALHLAAARSLRADVFVTTELPGKPIFRVPGIEIRSIRPT